MDETPKRSILITKSEYALKVLENGSATKTYPVAVGEREDNGPMVYEEDFRTPEGSFRIKRVRGLNTTTAEAFMVSAESMGPNLVYYPFYLAHKWGEPFTDIGYDAYGPGLIELNYPGQEDIARYHKLLESGDIERDWHVFMEERWRGIFEHVAEANSIPFEEARLQHEKRRKGKRCFLEGKTFAELYETIPPEPSLPLAIHGTSDPAGIGHKISGGCVRMHNQHILELMRIAEDGMQVDIEN